MSTTSPREESEMTTNQERVHALISSAIDTLALDPTAPWFERELPKVAHALADAGLLMADLPEPHTVDRYPGSVCWEVCTDPSVAERRHVGVRVDHTRRIKVNIVGEVSPTEAREAAYALLAAADYAEQEQENG